MRAVALAAVLFVAGCGGGVARYGDVKGCLAKLGTVGVTRKREDGRVFSAVIVFPGAASGSGTILFHDSHRAMENGIAFARSGGAPRPQILDDTNDVYWSGAVTARRRERVAACFR